MKYLHLQICTISVVVGYFSEMSTFEGIIPLQEYLNFYDLPYETSLQSGNLLDIFKADQLMS